MTKQNMTPRRSGLGCAVASIVLSAFGVGWIDASVPSVAAVGPVAPAVAVELEFSERVVAGGPEDAVLVRHLKLRGSSRSIGRKLAEVAEKNHELLPARADPGSAGERLAFYRQNYPSHHQRSLGVADHFEGRLEIELEPTLLSIDMPSSVGCSVVFHPGDTTASGHSTLSRNYDFSTRSWDFLTGQGGPDEPACTSRPYLLEVYPDDAYASLSMCAYELLGGCLDGINSEGLTVALLANEGMSGATPTRTWRTGFSEVEIARYLLDTCATAEEAREALASIELYYFLLPCHYIVGDRYGDSFIWEYSADGSERFFTEGENATLCVTNHSLARFARSQSFRDELAGGSSLLRYAALQEATDTSEAARSVEEMKRINRLVWARDSGPVRGRTLWHALYDCEARSLSIDFYLGEQEGQEANEKRSGYLSFALESADSSR